MVVRCSDSGRHFGFTDPAWIKLGHSRSIVAQRMATPKLKRRMRLIIFVLAIAGRQYVTSKSLNRCGGQYRRQLGQVGAPGDTGQTLFDCLPKSFEQIETDELLVGGADGVAITGIRHGIGHRHGVNDLQRRVNGDAQPEIVNRLARGAGAGS